WHYVHAKLHKPLQIKELQKSGVEDGPKSRTYMRDYNLVDADVPAWVRVAPLGEDKTPRKTEGRHIVNVPEFDDVLVSGEGKRKIIQWLLGKDRNYIRRKFPPGVRGHEDVAKPEEFDAAWLANGNAGWGAWEVRDKVPLPLPPSNLKATALPGKTVVIVGHSHDNNAFIAIEGRNDDGTPWKLTGKEMVRLKLRPKCVVFTACNGDLLAKELQEYQEWTSSIVASKTLVSFGLDAYIRFKEGLPKEERKKINGPRKG
ncbi:MAG: hypothetical protein N3A38_17360, partial [Planctomycetota bacterium]|nr:hypothetical protein [Planctomycetota bacterium]